MNRVVIESPFAGDVEKNVLYARQCTKDSLMMGEAPIVSHLLYTQDGILYDGDKEERLLGIKAGHQWIDVCDCVVVYHDFGISMGMRQGIEKAEKLGKPDNLTWEQYCKTLLRSLPRKSAEHYAE